MRGFIGILSLAAVAFASVPAHAVIINTFDGSAGQQRGDFLAALPPNISVVNEDLNDNVWNGATISFVGSGHTGPGVAGGKFSDRITTTNSTVITYARPILAFGADWSMSDANNTSLGLIINTDSGPVPVEVPNSHAFDFFGFISDTPFTQIVLTGGTQGGPVDEYMVDDIVTAQPIPLPAPGILLAGAAFAGLVAGRRRRK